MYNVLCMLCIKYTWKCFQLQSIKQRSIQDQQDLLELNATMDKMVENVRKLERSIARKKAERENVLNRDKERGKNGICKSGIINIIIKVLQHLPQLHPRAAKLLRPDLRSIVAVLVSPRWLNTFAPLLLSVVCRIQVLPPLPGGGRSRGRRETWPWPRGRRSFSRWRRPRPGTSTSSNTPVVLIMTSATRQVRPRLHLQFIGGNKEKSKLFINSFRRLHLFNLSYIPCCLMSKLQLCSSINFITLRFALCFAVIIRYI